MNPPILLPVGHEHREIEESQLRDVQKRLLYGLLVDGDRDIIDACISYVCVSGPRNCEYHRLSPPIYITHSVE